MNNLEKQALASVRAALASISKADAKQIYALSFFLSDEDDDARRPCITLGFNTLAQWQSSCPGAVGEQPLAKDAQEAKWNYAFWLQNQLALLGAPDTQFAALAHEWIVEQGWWYSDEDEFSEEAEIVERCDEAAFQIRSGYIELAIRLAQQLHSGGIFAELGIKPVPIIVHELEYYSAIAQQTLAANPAGLANEFVAWVNSLASDKASA